MKPRCIRKQPGLGRSTKSDGGKNNLCSFWRLVCMALCDHKLGACIGLFTMEKEMKKKILIVAFIIIDLYLFSYVFVRQTHMEIREKDKMEYVIFPENKILYYIYRPLSIIDGAITGMRFHIGPHQ